MKVQTKITLLLVLVVATFLAGLAAFRVYDQRKFRRIGEARYEERKNSFAEFLAYHGGRLKTFVEYDSALDQMVQAIAGDERQWFEDNLGIPRLDSVGANVVAVYGPDGGLVFQKNNLDAEDMGQAVLPQEKLKALFGEKRFAHYFAKLPSGTILEIRAASVHRSNDFERKESPAGFLFAGRVWSRPALREMSLFTGNDITLVVPASRGEDINNEMTGLITFSQTLRNWNGKPVAELVVKNESPVVRELRRSSGRLLVYFILFALVLVLLLLSSLGRWVRRPLRQIMTSLSRDDLEPIARLSGSESEFGALARTVQHSFQQRDNLLREMEERRATEEALRKSEDELRHSHKMEAVGQLAGGIAHDFNNLLTAIIGYSEVIIRAPLDPTVKTHADTIRKAGEQAATLTRQLLAFSRKQLLQPKVIDLNHLVADMKALLRRVIGERFELQTLPDAAIGTVLADPSQIEQVILNLGVNARDAMPDGGKLIIRTANVQLDKWTAQRIAASLAAGDYVELSVADTGQGMDEKTKSRIFEPFFTTKGPGKGTGLGLATVYGIVRQSGGGIQVESQIGKGSTFRIYLPLERSPVDQTRAVIAPIEKSRNPETILVAEDEQVVRELICHVLSEEGYTVICAEDGHGALRMAREFDDLIHLLVTDVIMPHMNGPELAAQLATTRPEIKVLYVSGYSDNDIGGHGVLHPRIALLQKPFTPQALARKIRDVIQRDAHAQVAPVSL